MRGAGGEEGGAVYYSTQYALSRVGSISEWLPHWMYMYYIINAYTCTMYLPQSSLFYLYRNFPGILKLCR